MYAKRIFFALMLVFISVAAVSASDVNMSDKTSASDLENPVLEAENVGTFTDLNQSLSTGSTVDLDKDYEYDYATDTELYGGVVIDRTVTINGNDHSIKSNSARCFVVSKNGHVIINDLHFIGDGTNSFYNGGCIYNEGTLTLINCTIENFAAARGGGAIYNDGGLGISKSRLIDNTIVVAEEGTKGSGGAIQNNYLLLILNSQFSGNSADYGGSIANMNMSSLTNIGFSNNRANLSGGAIYNHPGAICHVNESGFEYNSAKYGGALYNCNASYDEFFQNTAEKGNNMMLGSAHECSKSLDVNDYAETAISFDEKANTLSITQSGSYIGDKRVTVKFRDGMGNPLKNRNLIIAVVEAGNYDNILKTDYVVTNSNGEVSYKLNMNPGRYAVFVIDSDDESVFNYLENVNVVKKSVKFKASKITTTYNSGKSFNIRVYDTGGKPIAGVKVKLKIYTGKKYKTVTLTSNSKGIASYKVSGLAVGTHKVVISAGNGFSAKSISSSIKVKKKKLSIHIASSKVKDGVSVIVAVYDKSKLRFINGLKIQMKVYTGKKYKKFNLITGTLNGLDGCCGIATNALSKGTHKVVIKIVNKNYMGSKNGKVKIKKKFKSNPKAYILFTKNKVIVKRA